MNIRGRWEFFAGYLNISWCKCNFGDDDMTRSRHPQHKLSVMESFVMAVGGMIEDGVFSVLGSVVAIAGHLASVAFLIAGILTLITARSSAGLYEKFKTAGGRVTFVKVVTGSRTFAGHIT